MQSLCGDQSLDNWKNMEPPKLAAVKTWDNIEPPSEQQWNTWDNSYPTEQKFCIWDGTEPPKWDEVHLKWPSANPVNDSGTPEMKDDNHSEKQWDTWDDTELPQRMAVRYMGWH